jgi:hemerythrin-like domain-containing protein
MAEHRGMRGEANQPQRCGPWASRVPCPAAGAALMFGKSMPARPCDALCLAFIPPPEHSMTHAATRIIREEHQALAAMLNSVLLMLAQQRRDQCPPDFASLRAMLFYLDEFPEQRHHRKETELLFPKLRARTPLARDLLDRLDEDHLRGEARIRELEHRLLAFEMMGESRRAAFEQAAAHYVDFYLAHMALEEREILPLAERVLTEDDWTDIDEAFRANRDPLTGCPPEAQYQQLFTRIVSLIPAPIGLGSAR